VIKLIAFVKRHPDLTPEEFHAHLRDVHAPLVANTKHGSHVLYYERNPRPLDDYKRTGENPGYDGVTMQLYESIDAFWASLTEPDYAEVAADVESFMDTSATHWVLTEEPVVVFDRRPGATPAE